ncbi:MAG: acyltransferase [candidate division WOR-3 bacterium]|nr:acyltransferase [candidate division WOR-3 bacterium]MCX7756803.1 acyltransferase [candidate division WOR-3 bacterium]MDW7988201.1 nitrilase-related carbon-nitrogen hydrolase [candidate division WOR-3 bacterium]
MRIGFYQFAPILGNKVANLEKIERTLNTLNTDLIVLPELATTGYLFKSRAALMPLAEKIPDGETTQLLLKIAKKKNFAIVCGLVEKENNNLYNSAVLVTPQGKVYTYRKAHLFFEEKLIFKPGNIRYRAVKYKNTKLGIIICFDYMFPEATRSLALDGAEIICHPSNLILPFGERVTISRAIENRVFFIMANRVGFEKIGKKQVQFWGRSQIISPTGEILAKAGADNEEVQVVNVYHKLASNKNVTKYNNIFKDRRVDLYYQD